MYVYIFVILRCRSFHLYVNVVVDNFSGFYYFAENLASFKLPENKMCKLPKLINYFFIYNQCHFSVFCDYDK